MMEKQEWRVATILLILIVQVNAKSIHISKGYKPNSFGKSPLGRYLSERRHIIFNHRDTPTFTDVERTFQEEGLKAHNIYRARHCVLPLVLDDEINARAKAYALHLASNDSKLIHSTDRGGRLGENLYAVTRSNPITYPDAAKATHAWYAEISYYNYSKPGYTKNIAHFSQVVWKDSQRLGIGYAYARENRKLYVVAMYGPPGNYGFAYSTNVLEPTCS